MGWALQGRFRSSSCALSHMTVDSCVGLNVVRNEQGNTPFTVDQVTAKIYSQLRSGQEPSAKCFIKYLLFIVKATEKEAAICQSSVFDEHAA